MAPLPTIGNCVRVAFNWNAVGGVSPVNVLHIITNSTSEEDIGAAMTESIIAGGAGVFQCVYEGYLLNSYTITLLDGHSAGQIVSVGATVGGQATGHPVPQVAGVLSLRTNQRGARGRGRLFLGPVGEGVIEGGVVSTGVRSAVVSAWNDLNDELATTDITGSLGVASYVHEDVHGVTNISMRAVSGTQRRRNNQLL